MQATTSMPFTRRCRDTLAGLTQTDRSSRRARELTRNTLDGKGCYWRVGYLLHLLASGLLFTYDTPTALLEYVEATRSMNIEHYDIAPLSSTYLSQLCRDLCCGERKCVRCCRLAGPATSRDVQMPLHVITYAAPLCDNQRCRAIMFATLMSIIARAVDAVNFLIPGRRWQLFEFCDLWMYATQDTLSTPSQAARLTSAESLTLSSTAVRIHSRHNGRRGSQSCSRGHRRSWRLMPSLKRSTALTMMTPPTGPLLISALALEVRNVPLLSRVRSPCHAGPVPRIERLVNRGRKAKKQIPFRLSDIHPNLDAWMDHAALSDNLSFVPQPVDASNPPFSVISTTTAGEKDLAFRAGLRSNGNKIFRLFCLAFHHFDDETAKRVIKSSLETSDAFAIIELQDRRIGSLALMLLEFWLLLLVTMFWFWHDDLHLLLTYAIPVLPAIHSWDGFVSCLRTRTFEETIRLVEAVQGREKGDHALLGNAVSVTRGNWTFTHSRTLHTWPVGYMEVTFGRTNSRTGDPVQ